MGKAAAAVVAAPIAGVIWAADKVFNSSSSSSTPSERQSIGQASQNFARSESLSSSSNVRQVENLADTVRNYRQQYRSRAERIERNCQDYVDDLVRELIKKIRENKELANDYGLDNIERRQRELKNRIRGSIVSRLETDVSLDNYECRQILQMSKGSTRQRRMEEFVEHTFDGAKNDFAERAGRILQDQVDDVIDYMQGRLGRQERELSQAERDFDRWEREKRNDSFNAEAERLKPSVKLYALDRIGELVDEKARRVA